MFEGVCVLCCVASGDVRAEYLAAVGAQWASGAVLSWRTLEKREDRINHSVDTDETRRRHGVHFDVVSLGQAFSRDTHYCIHTHLR